MEPTTPNHYAILGLDRDCTDAQVRSAYRILAKQHHPDVNGNAREAVARTQELNAAYEVLGDPEKRAAYDRELNAASRTSRSSRAHRSQQNVSEEIHLRLEEFFKGTTLEVRVSEPASPQQRETYSLSVPPNTAPGARFRVARENHPDGGFVVVRVRLQPHFRFKARGSDLRCDLKIKGEVAARGGQEFVAGPTGGMLRVAIPKGVSRNEIIRIAGEGLPKPNGGRGDLLVRIVYRPEVRISRAFRR